ASPQAKGSRQVFLAEVASGKIYPASDTIGDNFSPAVDPNGRYLYFLSSRAFDPVYDKARFSLGFPLNVQLYLVTLREDPASPFDRQRRGSVANGKGENGNGEPKPIQIDPEGLPERMVAFPVPEGRYVSLVAAPDRVFYMSEPVKGYLGRRFFDEPSHHSLSQFTFDNQKT